MSHTDFFEGSLTEGDFLEGDLGTGTVDTVFDANQTIVETNPLTAPISGVLQFEQNLLTGRPAGEDVIESSLPDPTDQITELPESGGRLVNFEVPDLLPKVGIIPALIAVVIVGVILFILGVIFG